MALSLAWPSDLEPSAAHAGKQLMCEMLVVMDELGNLGAGRVGHQHTKCRASRAMYSLGTRNTGHARQLELRLGTFLGQDG